MESEGNEGMHERRKKESWKRNAERKGHKTEMRCRFRNKLFYACLCLCVSPIRYVGKSVSHQYASCATIKRFEWQLTRTTYNWITITG